MDIIFYVICCNELRKDFMKEQFTSLNIPYEIVYFDAFTPDNSQDWLSKTEKYASDRLQCCFRSHVGVLKDFMDNHKHDYVCVIEDDVCFLKEGFVEKLEFYIKQYENVKMNGVDYISIGYLPTITSNTFKTPYLDDEKFQLVRNENGLYYDFANCGFTIWGTQCQIFPRKTCDMIIDTLYKENGDDVLTSANEYYTKYGYYQNKVIYLTPDAVFPTLFSQSVVYPPLCMEGRMYSEIHNNDESELRFQNIENYGMDLTKYYNF